MDEISWYDFGFWGKEKDYVSEALDSTWLSGGEYVNKFEKSVSNLMNNSPAFAVSNGTAALQLAYLAIGLEPGDEVIVPSFGFLAAANVLKLMHVKPIFVDVDENNWCMKSSNIIPKITTKTKAIVVIHNYGVVEEIEEISRIAKKNSLFLIEDCAESIFSKYGDKFCGTFGDLGTFSFHATKTISTGEGGMVLCNNPELIDKITLIRSHGLRRKKHYWHEYFGNNFRLSNILAAIGVGQMEMLNEIIKNKIRVSEHYKKRLSNVESLEFQKFSKNSDPLLWAISIRLDTTKYDLNRDSILEKLALNGIECRPGFYTPNQLDIYSDENSDDFLVANQIASQIIVLPSYPKLENRMIDVICDLLLNILKNDS